MATTYNYQHIAAGFIVKNNRSGVINVLVSNGLISDMSAASLLTDSQLAKILYNYYSANGASAYGQLLRQIPLNTNKSSTELMDIEQLADRLDIAPAATMPGVPTTQSFESIFNSIWEKLVGKSETVITPVVVVEQKASPVTIGLIIGGIAILAIIAWVVVKY